MTTTIAQLETLTGPQKAALFLLAIGKEQSAKLVARFDEDEVQTISRALSGMGSVSAPVVESLFATFISDLADHGDLMGGYDTTERMLSSALPADRVAQIMEEIRGPAGRTLWDKLGNVNETVLANYLKNEYPQTVAVVLGKVSPAHAARVLALLPENLANEVIMRMLRAESVQKDILESVEHTLRTEFMSNVARGARRDAHELIAEIFNNLDRQTEARFVAALEDRNKEAADRIKSLMFTFDDLTRLSDRDMQTLMRSIAKDKLPIALKGASEALRDLFIGSMSQRASKMLKEEIEVLGPVKLREVDEAQAAIIAQAKDLAAQGQIEIRQAAEDEMVL